MQFRVLGLVDDPHAAFTELGEDLVVADGPTNLAGPILPLSAGRTLRDFAGFPSFATLFRDYSSSTDS